MNLRELLAKREAKMAEARQILAAAETEKRSLTDEQRSQFDALSAEITSLGADIQRVQASQGWQVVDQRTGAVAQQGGANIGMGRNDLQKYSLVKLIGAMASFKLGNQRALDDVQLELEASAAVEKRMGRAPQGVWVPYDFLSFGGQENRDLVVGTTTAGGFLKQTDLDAQNFIEILRNKMMVRAAGATVLSGLVGDLAIPKQSGAGTAYWVAENTAPTESQQVLAQVPLAPKTVGAYTDISRKLLKQSSIDVEMMVRGDLANVVAVELDRASLHGSGSANQPTGIAATSGIGSVVGGANGLAIAWSHIVDLESAVGNVNADQGKLAYFVNTKSRGAMKKTMRVATYGDTPIWQVGNPQPLNDYPAFVTNNVASNLTKGTSSGVCSALFFGNWAELLIGLWGGLDLLVDPYTGSTAGTVRVVTLQDVDIAVRHAESFSAMLDALTA